MILFIQVEGLKENLEYVKSACFEAKEIFYNYNIVLYIMFFNVFI
jgi:hypothetical protein